MHEVITLQFGQQANYLGTHYWNTQESYFTYSGEEESPVNHDISFRPGIGPNGDETYSPRTLIYDLKGAFGTLRRENALYELQQQETSAQQGGWSGVTIPLQLPPIQPSPYQQALESGSTPPRLTTETVRFWSDYNHIYYHPRSIVQLNEYELSSSLMPFERWGTGEELFASLDREHDLLDRDLRLFLEECDQLQGLQIFTGIDDAWGGFASKYLERIADDLGKGCRWVSGLFDGKQVPRAKQMLQMSNTAQSLVAMNTTASLHLPLSSVPGRLPSYIELDANSRWHTSALQASVVESVTLPTRLRQAVESGRATFDQIETTLNNEGNRRVAAAGLSSEPAANTDTRSQINGHHDTRMANGHANGVAEDGNEEAAVPDIDFMPDFRIPGSSRRVSGARSHTFSRTNILRGYEPSEQDEDAELRGRAGNGPRTATYSTDLLFPSLSSYPSIMRFPARPEKFAIRSSIVADTGAAARIRTLEGFVRHAISVEEREALSDALVSMAEEYEEGWSDDEDYGED